MVLMVLIVLIVEEVDGGMNEGNFLLLPASVLISVHLPTALHSETPSRSLCLLLPHPDTLSLVCC